MIDFAQIDYAVSTAKVMHRWDETERLKKVKRQG